MCIYYDSFDVSLFWPLSMHMVFIFVMLFAANNSFIIFLGGFLSEMQNSS